MVTVAQDDEWGHCCVAITVKDIFLGQKIACQECSFSKKKMSEKRRICVSPKPLLHRITEEKKEDK